jgi:hypothetical protein
MIRDYSGNGWFRVTFDDIQWPISGPDFIDNVNRQVAKGLQGKNPTDFVDVRYNAVNHSGCNY